MKLGAFLEKHKAALPPNMGVDHVAVKHPETGLLVSQSKRFMRHRRTNVAVRAE